MNILKKLSLIQLILIGMVLGFVVGHFFPSLGIELGLLGSLFTQALKSVAPILVFIIILSAISQHNIENRTNIKTILILYLVSTFAAAVVAVLAGFIYPIDIVLDGVEKASQATGAPAKLHEVFKTLLGNMIANPVKALAEGNFLGILTWAVILGLYFRKASNETKVVLKDMADGVNAVVQLIIKLAPIGIFGIVASTYAESGIEAFKTYLVLIVVLVVAMFISALIVNPLITWFMIRKNPYPLVFTCLKESGVTAFFTRSSAANIPVNMNLCRKLKLNPDTYSISIPLGATINMAGAAITITVMTMAAVHTLGIHVSFLQAVILSALASLGACGASGVAGGSLLLIPMACALFSIPADISAQLIAIGLMIGIIQDSCETALNSSTDVLFTAAAEMRQIRKS